MTYAVESLGAVILNLSLIGTGMALGIIALVMGFTQGMTKNEDHKAMLFGSLAWTIALIVPDLFFAGLIFSTGTIGIMMSIMPIINKIEDNNIVVLTAIIVILNIFLSIGTGAYAEAPNWKEDYDASEAWVINTFDVTLDTATDTVPESGLCMPNSQTGNGTACQTDVVSGSFIPSLYVPLASIIAIGTYVFKAVAFIGSILTAPLWVGILFANSEIVGVPMIAVLMGFLTLMLQMAIFYKLVRFIILQR